MTRKNGPSSGMITGIILILVGFIWVLINYDILDISIWRFWPLAIVLVGLAILMKERNLNNPIALIMVVMGSAFLLANLDIIEEWGWYDAVNMWPVALIIVGISVVSKNMVKGEQDRPDMDKNGYSSDGDLE